MAFLDKEQLGRVGSKSMSAKRHPILKNGSVPLSVRNAYLQGCIFATLMDDGKVSDDERVKLDEIARSLQLSSDDLGDGINVVTSIDKSERVAFITEIVNQVKDPQCACWFAVDFERLMAIGGTISEDGKALMDFICRAMFGRKDWRVSVWEVERDSCSTEDFKRYLWAAEEGDRFAQQIVGNGYLYGNGIAKDTERGVAWLEKSASQGNGSAQMELARLYLAGELIMSNDSKAEEWLRKAISNGCREAQKDLDQLIARRQSQEKKRKEREGIAKKKSDKRKAKLIQELDKRIESLTCRAILDPLGVTVGVIACVIVGVIVWRCLCWWQIILCIWMPFVIGLFCGLAAQGIYWFVIQKLYRHIKIGEVEKIVRREYEEDLKSDKDLESDSLGESQTDRHTATTDEPLPSLAVLEAMESVGVHRETVFKAMYEEQRQKEKKDREKQPCRKLKTFQYIAMDAQGKEQRGSVDAADRAQAISAVRAAGLFPSAIDEMRGTCSGG